MWVSMPLATDIECPFGNYLDDRTCKCVPWFDHQPGGAYCIDIILLYKLQFMCAYIMCMIVHWDKDWEYSHVSSRKITVTETYLYVNKRLQ